MNVYKNVLSRMDTLAISSNQNLKKNIENRIGIIWIIILIALIVAGVVYAFYCTSRGYAFDGGIRWNWPRVWEVGIACKP